MMQKIMVIGFSVSSSPVGAVMAFKTPIKSLGMIVLFILPFSLAMIPNIVCHVIGGLIGSFCLPVVLLAFYLFALDRFDELVNKTKFPELVGILRP
jgi:hypothetical protein